MLELLNGWFQETLTSLVEDEATEKDLELPMHGKLAGDLLGENSVAANMSFPVF